MNQPNNHEVKTDFEYPFMVFGNPIQHSRSPRIHQLFAEQTQIDHQYGKYCIDLSLFAETMKTYFTKNGRGANITVPFKEEAFNFVDNLTETAKAAGAVNTMRREVDGKLTGHNTDGIGLLSDLKRLGFLGEQCQVLLLGAGGASRGVILPLLDAGAKIVITNRTFEKAEQLATSFSELAKSQGLSGEIKAISFAQLNEPTTFKQPSASKQYSGKAFDLIINATSASISGQVPDISAHCFDSNTAVYDMFYGSEPTAFLSYFQQLGVKKCADGLGMLVEQAAYAFEFWHGILPETQQVLDKLRKEL